MDALKKMAHGLVTGDEVRFNGILPTATNATLSTGTSYFVRRTDDNVFALHATSAEATNNQNAIKFNSSSGNATLNEIVS